MRRGLFGTAAVAIAAPVVLSRLAPPKLLALQCRLAVHPSVPSSTASSALGAVDAVVGALAWLLAGWLAAIIVAIALGAAPGRVGALAGRVAEVITPALLRGLLRTSVGAGLGVGLAGGLGTTTAPLAFHSATVMTGSTVVTTALRPTGITTLTTALTTALNAGCPGPADGLAPPLDWPAPGWCPTPVALPAPNPLSLPAGSGMEPAASGPYRVAPGDSLWSIARSRLGPDPNRAAVASSWPRWWAANRAVIGPDPDLLRPGTVLIPPG